MTASALFDSDEWIANTATYNGLRWGKLTALT